MVELFFFHGILQGRYREVDAVLPGYEQFTRGFSTMRKKSGSCMSGVLAWVPSDDVEDLDRIEGVSNGFYVRFKVDGVRTIDGEVFDGVWVYQQLEDYESDNDE